MKKIEYIGFRIFVLLFKFCPFKILYLLSDLLYFVLFHIFRYRRTVVYENIKNSFPSKTHKEIQFIMKKFYIHLSDITLESIKAMSISENQLRKRYHIKNPELPNKYFADNKSLLCLTSHYGNWEYGILATNNYIKHQAIALYLPLSNKMSEKYGLKRRSRFGMKMVAVQETKSIFEKTPDIPVAIIMAADQSPSNLEKSIRIKFLNRDTACLHGPEAYAKKTGLPVLYLRIIKPNRGRYILEFEELIKNPADEKPGEITQKYFQKLERDILNEPAYWLWSHRRWKHSYTNI